MIWFLEQVFSTLIVFSLQKNQNIFCFRKGFHPFKRHFKQNWRAENMPVLAGTFLYYHSKNLQLISFWYQGIQVIWMKFASQSYTMRVMVCALYATIERYGYHTDHSWGYNDCEIQVIQATYKVWWWNGKYMRLHVSIDYENVDQQKWKKLHKIVKNLTSLCEVCPLSFKYNLCLQVYGNIFYDKICLQKDDKHVEITNFICYYTVTHNANWEKPLNQWWFFLNVGNLPSASQVSCWSY